jgi:hypothetical protein
MPDLKMVGQAPRQFAPAFGAPTGERPQTDPFSSAVRKASNMCARKMKPVLSSRSRRRSPRSHRPSTIVSPSGSNRLPRGLECSRSVQKRGHAGSRGTEQRHHSARADPGIDRAERIDIRRALAAEDQRLLHDRPDTGPASPGIGRGLRFQRADPLRFPIRQPRQ